MWVRADSKLVRVYFEGSLVNTRPRQPPGGRSTDHADYPLPSSPPTRDPQRIIRQPAQEGEKIGTFAEALLSGPLHCAKLRQGQKLLRLGGTYGRNRLELACQRALAFELINVRRLEGILRQDLEQVDLLSETSSDTRVIPPRGRF